MAVLDGHYEHPGALLRSACGSNYRSLWQSDAIRVTSLLAEERSGSLGAQSGQTCAILALCAVFFFSHD